jgi:hypothetical protein
MSGIVQIKRDASGNSKGFGFIRYEDYSSQAKALGQRHYVNNRWVEVKIPASKVILFCTFINSILLIFLEITIIFCVHHIVIPHLTL